MKCGFAHTAYFVLFVLGMGLTLSCAEPVCVEPGPEEPPPCEMTPFSNPCPTDTTVEPPDAALGDCTRLDDGSECMLETAFCFDRGICQDGVCEPVLDTEMDCPQDQDPSCVPPCCKTYCEPATGECTLTVRQQPGDWCNSDEDVCTLEKCDTESNCISTGEFITCQAEMDLDPCSSWSCLPEEGCIEGPFAEGNACDDGDPCTGPDTCQINVGCTGGPLAEIDDNNICTEDSCDQGTLVHDPIVCEQATDKCLGVNECDPLGSAAICAIDPATVITCPSTDEWCTFSQCNSGTGDCDTLNEDNGTFCCVDELYSIEKLTSELCSEATNKGFCLDGQCMQNCQPVCDSLAPGQCGPDGCGGFCPCPNGKVCNQGVCEDICVPDCVAEGKVCGDDGCGGSCGDCMGCDGVDNALCDNTGQCTTVCCPDCVGKVCGDDGCGNDCGVCEGCDGPDNALCLPNGTCDDTPTDCKALTVCAAHCGGAGSCINICVEEACTNAQTAFALWGGCIISECPAQGASCIQTALTGPCGDEMASCSQLPTPVSDCFEIVACQAGCSSGTCAENCKFQASAAAQSLYNAWQSCIITTCGPTDDTACWEEADAGVCNSAMLACLAP